MTARCKAEAGSAGYGWADGGIESAGGLDYWLDCWVGVGHA